MTYYKEKDEFATLLIETCLEDLQKEVANIMQQLNDIHEDIIECGKLIDIKNRLNEAKHELKQDKDTISKDENKVEEVDQ